MRIQRTTGVFIFSLALSLAGSASTQPSPTQLSQLPAEAQATVWKQLAELTASDAAGNVGLGYSVAISGNTIAVGAPYETIGTNEHQGAVYVFTRPASGWSNMTQTAKLTVSDEALSGELGYSVAFSGNTIVAGAPGANAAYVFVEPASGWADTQTPIAKFTDPGWEAEFGVSVAIAGNTIAVGVPFSDSLGIAQGVVCVYVKPAGGWATTTLYSALLTASDGAGSNLGWSVSISSNTVVAGDPGSNTGQGASYVFVKPVAGWTSMTQTAKLTASDGMPYDDFGDAVAVGGTIIAVGAPNAVTGTEFGKAYLFAEPSGGWADATQTAALLASDARSGAQFGWSAAVWGNMVAVGAFAGSTYGYRMPANGWTNMPESVELTGTQAAGQGHSTAIGASMIVAGAFDSDNGIGAAYVFGPQ
jgi:hypothetical protein